LVPVFHCKKMKQDPVFMIMLASFSYLSGFTIDKGLDDYKILKKSSLDQFLIPKGWAVLSLADLAQPGVQAAMLALFTSTKEVDMFNEGELKVIKRIDIEEEVPEYDIVTRTSEEEFFIIPNGWQTILDTHMQEPGIQNMLEQTFSQNETYRDAFNAGLLAIIKKGWVRVPINERNSAKFQPIFVKHLTLIGGENKNDMQQKFTEIFSTES